MSTRGSFEGRPNPTTGNVDEVRIRLARATDAGAIERVVRLSARGLGARFYSTAQIDGLDAAGTLDRELIAAGRYFVAEALGELVGSGGWSPGAPAEVQSGPDDRAAAGGIATVRAVFVHPTWVGRGVGRRIVARIEAEAARAGHRTFELLALLSSVRFYRRIGYQDLAICALELQNGVTLPSVHMRKAASTEVAANG